MIEYYNTLSPDDQWAFAAAFACGIIGLGALIGIVWSTLTDYLQRTMPSKAPRRL